MGNTEEKKNDGFLPQGEGWVEVSTSGAAIYKPEAAVAEGKAIVGVAYDVILCKGGTSNCKIWEAIVFRLDEPTIGEKDGEQVEVPAGEDILVPNHAILSDIARRATHPRTAPRIKLLPTEQKETAANKKFHYWDYRIGFGPVVDRAKENLFRIPERQDILQTMHEYVEGLKGGKPDDGSVKIVQSFKQRLRVLEAAGDKFVPQLPESTTSAA